MILAISQMFSLVGNHVTDGRALIELQGQLRNAGFRLQEDLDGASVVSRYSPDIDLHLGYTEINEGADWDLSDTDQTIGGDNNPWWLDDTAGIPPAEFRPHFDTANPSDPLNAAFTAFGDIDDVLMFTARSTGRPFVGRSPVGRIESHDAEIIYWTQFNDSNSNLEIDFGELSLCRRVLLIRPDLSAAVMPTFTQLAPADLRNFYSSFDLSVHPAVTQDAMGNDIVILIPNSLTDLARRENRIAHLPNVAANSPQAITPTMLPLSQAGFFPNLFSRMWLPPADDVVLADLLAFDVRAWDVDALVRQDDDPLNAGSPAGDLLRPGDVHWNTVTHTVGNGAFVDLNYLSNYASNPGGATWFSGAPDPKSGLAGTPKIPTYDTWTWAYEHDGIDQDLDNPTLVDEATDGLDGTHLDLMTGALTNQINGVDDPGERETQPPYASPLRGIEITLRVIELDTRQVRQSTIVSRLMPE
jgi:hypothetical protein